MYPHSTQYPYWAYPVPRIIRMCCLMRTRCIVNVMNCISGIEEFECGKNYSGGLCRCFTLFSHSNYEEGQNQGAVIVLWYLPLLCSFPLQFLALVSSPPSTRPQTCMHSDCRTTDKQLYHFASNHNLLYCAVKRTTSWAKWKAWTTSKAWFTTSCSAQVQSRISFF